jgi:hypothetical protein
MVLIRKAQKSLVTINHASFPSLQKIGFHETFPRMTQINNLERNKGYQTQVPLK